MPLYLAVAELSSPRNFCNSVVEDVSMFFIVSTISTIKLLLKFRDAVLDITDMWLLEKIQLESQELS